MNVAAALNLNLVRQHRQLERFRDMAHKEVDKLVDSLKEDLLCEESLTIRQISESFQQKKQVFLGDLLEEFICVHHQELFEQETASCPVCTKELKKQAETPRTIETLLGSCEITRPYFYCRDCQHGFFPVDEALELSRRKKQADLQSLALEFLAEMPFERASELFQKATGISFSDHRMHDLFACFADKATIEDIVPCCAEIDRRIEQVAGSQKRRPVLVVATDGAHSPTRPAGGRDHKRGPGEYREAKGFRIYVLDKDDIVQIASWHQIATAQDIAEDLKLVAERIPTEKVRVCLIGDGASWLWRAMQEAFPKAREVLDYYHCSEHIHALAQLQYADEPHKALLWVESTMARLSRKGGVSYVIGGLRRMQPKNADVKELIRRTVNYLDKNKGRMNYRGARIGGYPVGSGGIESANKFICHSRIKRSGAWWLETNCNSMLKLRCSLVNGTFDETFSKYVTKLKAKAFARNT